MINENHPIQRIKAYFNELKELVRQIKLDTQIYKEGTNAGQIAYHASQAANFWLRVRVANKSFDRNKDAELTEVHTIEEINKSIDLVLEACNDLINTQLNLNDKLKEEVAMKKFTVGNVGTALIFITSHTAEHVAELTMLRDFVSTSK